MSCCGNIICSGCLHADRKQNLREICPFCRAPWSKTHADAIEQLKKRLEVNDPHAFYNIGVRYFQGLGVVQDKSKGLECFFRAADLGSAEALLNIANAYYEGNGTVKDETKALHFYELAAMQGNNISRRNLAVTEYKAGKYDKALKHLLIACGRGHAESLENLRSLFIKGHATKEDYEKALQSFRDCIAEIQSDKRDEAAAFSQDYRYIPLVE